MLARLVQFSLSQRLFILLATLLVAGAGWVAYMQLPIDAFPDVASTQVKIIMKAPGMTPEEIESRIAVPIEVEMLGIPKTKILRSMTKYGLVDVTIDFEDGVDIYWARQQVSERLGGLTESLPAGITGGMAPITTPLGEMFMFTVESEGMSLAERRSLLDWVIRPALRTVPGVADVNALGGVGAPSRWCPISSRLAPAGDASRNCKEAISANNRNDGAGRLGEGDEVLLVRSEGSITSLDDLRAVVVTMKDGVPVRVGNLAEVQNRHRDTLWCGDAKRSGLKPLQGLVLGLAGANAQKVVEGVRKKLAELQPTLPQGVRLDVFYDRASLVDQGGRCGLSRAARRNGAGASCSWCCFSAICRAALTVALVLPLAALITFILMRGFGMSANLMSLGGLAIAIGMLVDAAVVVVENIVQRLAHRPTAGKSAAAASDLPRGARGGGAGHLRDPDHHHRVPAAADAAGLEGKLFVPVALTIVFALAGSLLLSLTVIPVLASYLLREVKTRGAVAAAQTASALRAGAGLGPAPTARRSPRWRWRCCCWPV
jgi:cobalt-zinc-cadmium resistance protein CzcA